ncbi:MAG TPA: sigma-70 family RNA polymerase sigma factor, partial [Halioglobus sp.]
MKARRRPGTKLAKVTDGGRPLIATVGRDCERANQDSSSEDWNLIRLVGRGDQAALERLYKKYYSGLYRFILQITRRTDCIEEIINDVMFVVWESAADVEPRSKASTWILGIAHNKAIQALRRCRRSDGVALDEDSSANEDANLDVSIRKMESDEVLFALMRALSPEQRAVMELVYYHGLHYTEIAQVIDCPESTVKTRVFHARRKLRDVWPGLTGTATG